MNTWHAVILGIVEGVTEYLPVSSTGHLILTQRMLGIAKDHASDAYAICIQAGAILAVLGLYRERVKQMVQGTCGLLRICPPNALGWRLAVDVVVAFLPAAIVGLLANDWIEERLFGLWPVVVAWFVGGVAILLVGWWRRGSQPTAERSVSIGHELDQLTWPMALGIGMIQCLAMWPGMSRSLVTIVGGLVVGLSLSAAVEFSFLLGVVTLLAATAYKLKDSGGEMLESYTLTSMLVGAAAAWFSAVLAVRWMVGYLRRHGLQLFGYYRIILALLVGAALITGSLTQ